MKEYEKSHPWISFRLDLNKFKYSLWMALGEAQSKCEHIANTPLAPDVAEKMHGIYLAKGVHGTTAIEGNTLSEQEVMEKIAGRLKLPPSKEYLEKEVENIIDACNKIGKELIADNTSELNCRKLEEFNGMVLNGLEIEDGIVPGRLRNHPVIISGVNYRGAPAEDCRYLVDKLCDWLNTDFKAPDEKDNIVFGILKAIVAHLYIAWIHPFGDGNGRTGRLIEFQILLAAGVPTPAAHLLSNFYNETRQEYYRQLQKTSESGGNIVPFIEYAVNGFVESLKEQLLLIRKQVWSVTWENYIHDEFKNKDKSVDVRRRHLALDISRAYDADREVSISNVREISTRIAVHYAGKIPRTIQRDLEILKNMGLMKIDGRGLIRPNWGIILSFLPARRNL